MLGWRSNSRRCFSEPALERPKLPGEEVEEEQKLAEAERSAEENYSELAEVLAFLQLDQRRLRLDSPI